MLYYVCFNIVHATNYDVFQVIMNIMYVIVIYGICRLMPIYMSVISFNLASTSIAEGSAHFRGRGIVSRIYDVVINVTSV